MKREKSQIQSSREDSWTFGTRFQIPDIHFRRRNVTSGKKQPPETMIQEKVALCQEVSSLRQEVKQLNDQLNQLFILNEESIQESKHILPLSNRIRECQDILVESNEFLNMCMKDYSNERVDTLETSVKKMKDMINRKRTDINEILNMIKMINQRIESPELEIINELVKEKSGQVTELKDTLNQLHKEEESLFKEYLSLFSPDPEPLEATSEELNGELKRLVALKGSKEKDLQSIFTRT